MLRISMLTNAPSREIWPHFVAQESVVELFPRTDELVLLIHKKRGFGEGKVCGPGGRIEPGETPSQAAVRETAEEVGLAVRAALHVATLQFQFNDGFAFELRAFIARSWTGTAFESDEALPFWCAIDDIPYGRMWTDARSWLPLALDGRHVQGRFLFDGETMVYSQLAASEP